MVHDNCMWWFSFHTFKPSGGSASNHSLKSLFFYSGCWTSINPSIIYCSFLSSVMGWRWIDHVYVRGKYTSIFNFMLQPVQFRSDNNVQPWSWTSESVSTTLCRQPSAVNVQICLGDSIEPCVFFRSQPHDREIIPSNFSAWQPGLFVCAVIHANCSYGSNLLRKEGGHLKWQHN